MSISKAIREAFKYSDESKDSLIHREKIPDDVKQRLEARRVVWFTVFENVKMLHYKNFNEPSRAEVLLWVDKFTSSRFYLGGQYLAFEHESDTLLFKLKFGTIVE